jgi:hypothetical protein
MWTMLRDFDCRKLGLLSNMCRLWSTIVIDGVCCSALQLSEGTPELHVDSLVIGIPAVLSITADEKV